MNILYVIINIKHRRLWQMSVFFKKRKCALLKFIYVLFKAPTKQMLEKLNLVKIFSNVRIRPKYWKCHFYKFKTNVKLTLKSPFTFQKNYLLQS